MCVQNFLTAINTLSHNTFLAFLFTLLLPLPFLFFPVVDDLVFLRLVFRLVTAMDLVPAFRLVLIFSFVLVFRLVFRLFLRVVFLRFTPVFRGVVLLPLVLGSVLDSGFSSSSDSSYRWATHVDMITNNIMEDKTLTADNQIYVIYIGTQNIMAQQIVSNHLR